MNRIDELKIEIIKLKKDGIGLVKEFDCGDADLIMDWGGRK